MNSRFWLLRNIGGTFGILLSVMACQTTPDSSKNGGNAVVPGTAVSMPAPVPSPVVTGEIGSASEPISLTPVSTEQEQLAAYAPARAVPYWVEEGGMDATDTPSVDGLGAEPAIQQLSNPCDENNGGAQLSLAAGKLEIDQSSNEQRLSAPWVGSLLWQVPSALHSPALRALTGRVLGEHFGASLMRYTMTDDPTRESDVTTDDPLREVDAMIDELLREKNAMVDDELRQVDATVGDELREVDATIDELLRETEATTDDPLRETDAASDDQLREENTMAEDVLILAEKAASTGRMPLIELRRIYQQFPFTPEELSAPLSEAKEDNSPRRRALLFRAASEQQVPTAIAEVLKIALELARLEGLFELTTGLYGPYIQEFNASFALRWIGYEAGPAQFYLGEFCKGKKWRRYLENIAPNDPNARKALKRYWILEALSGVVHSSKIETEDIHAWLRTVRAEDPENANRKIQFTYWMLDALGVSLTVGNWDTVVTSGRNLGVSDRLSEIAQAAAQSQKYEVVALAAILIGNRPLREVPPHHMAKILRALVQVGLAEDARRLAIEVAITAQL
ncbi:MAG: hypothetical protein CMM28_11015 [Rhodospirillaceae bacterium]|nr:hypothetical protein [Rhodospirillaceae bacterium]|tara:strand:+ start:1490 stop:3187 length:1698 start_codon:yes stop_codon:yes gene_type:complete